MTPRLWSEPGQPFKLRGGLSREEGWRARRQRRAQRELPDARKLWWSGYGAHQHRVYGGHGGLYAGQQIDQDEQRRRDRRLVLVHRAEARFDNRTGILLAIVILVRNGLGMLTADQELEARKLFQFTVRRCQHPKEQQDRRDDFCQLAQWPRSVASGGRLLKRAFLGS